MITEGDRVSIDKTTEPARWNAIAFTSPRNLNTIYLQRLVGLPNETIEIAHGDVFANNQRLVKQPGIAEDMWILIHDTDHRPANESEAKTVWAASPADSAWKRSDSGWTYADSNAEEKSLLFYGSLTNDVTYNSLHPMMSRGENISDLQLDCDIGRFEGAGHFGFRWEFGAATAQVRISSSGSVEFTANDQAKTVSLGVPDLDGASVAFGVRDGQAFLSVNENAASALQVFPSELEAFKDQFRSNVPRCLLSIFASNCTLTLSRVRLKKDIHYQGAGRMQACNGCPGNPISLEQNEHYVLGDNTHSSHDSRYWRRVDPSLRGQYQLGTVPGDLILGPARMIFWRPQRWRYFPPAQ